MNALPPDRLPADADAPDGIDEGKRLMRTGGDKGLSLAERLSERLDRLTWQEGTAPGEAVPVLEGPTSEAQPAPLSGD